MGAYIGSLLSGLSPAALLTVALLGCFGLALWIVPRTLEVFRQWHLGVMHVTLSRERLQLAREMFQSLAATERGVVANTMVQTLSEETLPAKAPLAPRPARKKLLPSRKDRSAMDGLI